MPGYYDEIDLSFGWNGDLQQSSGDVKDTSSDSLQSLLDQIHSIAASMFGDWDIYPNRAAGLDDFIGEPNTRFTGDRLRERMFISLVGAELVDQDDLDVRVIPVHINKVLIVVKIYALPTAFNQLESGKALQTTIVFDSLEQQVFFLDKTPRLINV